MERSVPPAQPQVLVAEQNSFVFISVQKVRDTPEKVVFFYNHAGRDEVQEHYYTPDKQHVGHIYDDLRAGRHYAIWAVRTPINGKNRWVWADALELTQQQLLQMSHIFAATHSIYAAIVAVLWRYPSLDMTHLAAGNLRDPQNWANGPSMLEASYGDAAIKALIGGVKNA